MKNLLVYVNPQREFNKENSILIKIQIDNSFELGWDRNDIILLTNFDYEYSGVKAIKIEDNSYCEYSPISTKINAVVNAFDNKLIKDELYWLHDLDAFQLEPITEEEISLGRWDMALCDYGRIPKWSGGSIFFNKNAEDIFREIKKVMYRRKIFIDEEALYKISQYDSDIYNRIKKLNISYNFLPFNIRSCYKMAIKPLKIVHFNPFEGRSKLSIDSLLDFYKGKNKIRTSLITKRFSKILERYI